MLGSYLTALVSSSDCDMKLSGWMASESGDCDSAYCCRTESCEIDREKNEFSAGTMGGELLLECLASRRDRRSLAYLPVVHAALAVQSAGV